MGNKLCISYAIFCCCCLFLSVSHWQLLLKSKMLWLLVDSELYALFNSGSRAGQCAETPAPLRSVYVKNSTSFKLLYFLWWLHEQESLRHSILCCIGSWVLFTKHPPNDWLSSFSSVRFPCFFPLIFSSRSNNALSLSIFCRDQTVMKTLRLQRNYCSSTSRWQT